MTDLKYGSLNVQFWNAFDFNRFISNSYFVFYFGSKSLKRTAFILNVTANKSYD